MHIPPQIGRYRILDVLGKGSMGVVYRGLDETLERSVAVKVMSLHLAADEEGVRRFKREAKAAARLQHPNIVTIYELGEHEGAPFMAMELLEGVDLQRAIQEGLRPDPRVTLPIVLQLLTGLGYAHEHDIVHRDVKPSNVFLPRGRSVKIMDFGVARLAGGVSSAGMTAAGMVIGTPNYMSPEQARGAPVDGRSDLFSSGLILYELVTGEKAYSADTVIAVLFKITHESPDFTSLPRVPEWVRLRQVLERALARSPDERYPDARSMASDLAQALQDLGGSPDWASASDRGLMGRHTPRPMPVMAEPGPATPSSPEPPQPSSTLLAHGPLVAAGMLGGLAAVVLAVSLSMWMRSMSRTPDASRVPTAVTTAPTAKPTSFSTAPTTLASKRPASSPPTPIPPTPRPTLAAAVNVSPTPEQARPPSALNARLERANELYERGRYQSALNEARAVLARAPENEEARTLAEDAEAALVVENRLRKAREALKRGDRVTALAEVRAGLAVAPNDARLVALSRELAP